MNKHVIDVPQLVRAEKQDRVGDRQMQFRRVYTPPLDGSVDVYKDYDDWIERRIIALLQQHFPGYPWKAASNAQQGIVGVNIPILMGQTLHMAIRLADWSDLDPRMILRCGGQLLERMNLPLVFDANSFAHAIVNRHLFDFSDIGKRMRRD